MARPLQLASLGLSAALCALLWPWVTARLLASRRCAAAPGVFIHAAPVPLCGLAYLAVLRDELAAAGAASAYRAVAHLLFVATTVAAAATVLVAWRRRAALAGFVRPRSHGFVHPEWAALTFPLVATSTYTLLYAARVHVGSPAAAQAATVWASAVAVLCAAVVVPVDALYLLCGLPLWLRHGLPHTAHAVDGTRRSGSPDAVHPQSLMNARVV